MGTKDGFYPAGDQYVRNVFTITKPRMMNNGATDSTQNLVDVNTKGSIFRRKNFFRNVSLSLIVIIILLLIGLIILACCYAQVYWSNVMCTSEECLRSAANLHLSMDLSVDPCEDFYNYTCGKWTEEHINHGWYSRFSSFETINERITVAILNFLKSNASEDEPLPVKQSKDLYKSCMDVESINKLGYSVVYKYLKLVELPLIPKILTVTENESQPYRFDWVKADVNIKKLFAKDLFIQFTIDSDLHNRSKNVMYLGSSRSGSPLPSPIKNGKYEFSRTKSKSDTASEDNAKEQKIYEETYKKVARGVIKMIIGNISKIPDDLKLNSSVELLWNVTKHLSDMAGDDDYEDNDEDDDLDVRKIKTSTLQNMTDNLMKKNNLTLIDTKDIWKRYLTLLYQGISNITLDLDGEDYLYYLPNEIDYLTNIVVYLTKTPGVILEFYAWYQTVYAMIINTTSEMVNYIYGQSTEAKTSSVIRSRSMNCAENVVVRFMGVAVSYGIVDKAFLNSTKPKVETMLKNIKDAFIERVNRINWMDQKTKDATLEKSAEMLSFIGFPDWLLGNTTALEIYYSNIKIRNNTYLENMISIIKEYASFHLATLREENPRTWRTDPVTVNAYNYFGDNSINVPIAILSFPIYHLGLEVLNYGAIGSVLGHELTHGFDNTGRKFDKFGNFIQWWTNDTIATFENKTECFVEQYNNYTLPNIERSVNGKMTLGENLADNGGLHHAFLAYKTYVKQFGREKSLPGFQNYTHEQLFFLAYASVYCETPTRESLISQLKTDEHSPNPIRVLGTLQNSQDFADAFNCPVGSKMNPDTEKCRIW